MRSQVVSFPSDVARETRHNYGGSLVEFCWKKRWIGNERNEVEKVIHIITTVRPLPGCKAPWCGGVVATSLVLVYK